MNAYHVAALRRKFNKAQLEAMLETAVGNLAKGVTITSTSYEGFTATGVPNNMNTQQLISLLERAIQEMEGSTVPDVHYPDFRTMAR